MRPILILALLSTGCFEYDLVQEFDSPVRPPADAFTPEGPATAQASRPDFWDPPIDEPWWEEPWNEPPEGWLDDAGEPRGQARMTGGGSVDPDESHSFTLHCAGTHDANHLTLSWEDGTFHLEGVDWVACIDDPSLDAQQPVIGFDTVVGSGWGRLDRQEVDVWFMLTDDGEPGEADSAWILLDLGNVELEFEGYLVEGNHQAHAPI